MTVALEDLNAEKLRELFFFGINLVTEDGAELPDPVLDFYIQSALTSLEGQLLLHIKPRLNIVERMDYRQDVWQNFGFWQLRQRPITAINSMTVKLGDTTVFPVPATWMQIENRLGQLHLFPTLGTLSNVPMLGLTSMSPMLLRVSNAPRVFEVNYNTGMPDGIEEDMAEAILAFAALNIFNIMGDIVLGPGIAGLSMGLDGLSQSIQSTASAEHSAYGARITLYMKRLFGERVGDPGLMHALRSKWRMPTLTIL